MTKLAKIYHSVTGGLALDLPDSDLLDLIPEGYRPQHTLDALKNSAPYQDKNADVVRKLAVLGFKDSAIRDYFNVASPLILNMWKEAFPDFARALKDGREDADCKVAEALLKVACGYEEKAVKIFCHNGQIIYADHIRQHPPNVAAIKMWLEARQSGVWRNTDFINVEGSLKLQAHEIDDSEIEDLLKKAGLEKKNNHLSKLLEAD